MSLLIKGVTTFLGLTDVTESSFAGESLKSARVNAGETGMEFGGVSGGLEVVTEESFELFNGAAPAAFTDLQIQDAAGNKGAGLALIEVDCVVAAERRFYSRMNGETLDFNQWAWVSVGRTEQGADAGVLTYLLVPTDSNGLIEWRCNVALTPVVLTLRAFISGVSFPSGSTGLQIASGNAPTDWTKISLGTGPALAIFRCVNNDVAVRSCCFRRSGDTDIWPATANADTIQGINKGYGAQDNVSYAVCPTDEEGAVDWGAPAATDWDIYLLAYVKNVSVNHIEVFNATLLDQGLGAGSFLTVDLPVTKQTIAVIKNAAAVAIGGCWLRQTGLTADFPNGLTGSGGVASSGTWNGYMLQLTNEYGQLDAGGATAETNRFWLDMCIPPA